MTTTVIGDVKGLLESRPLTKISYNFTKLHYVVLSFVVEDWEAETQSSLNLSCLDFAAQPCSKHSVNLSKQHASRKLIDSGRQIRLRQCDKGVCASTG